MTRPSVRERVGRLVLAGTAFVLSLAASELVLRAVLLPVRARGYYVWPPQRQMLLEPSPGLMPGISGESRFITNADGLRGDELGSEHTFRILAIGGSTTECTYLDQSEVWTTLLQETLSSRDRTRRRVWVGNAGVSETTAAHHVVALQRLPLRKLHVDVIVVLVGVNDLIRRLSHEGLSGDATFAQPTEPDALAADVFRGSYYVCREDPLYKRTALWQMVRQMKQRQSSEHVEDDRGAVYATWREHRRLASEMRSDLPNLSLALQEYARHLNEMVDLSKQLGIRLVLVTQPTMWRSNLPEELQGLLWLGGIGDFQKDVGRPYYSVSALQKGMQSFNDVLLGVCKDRHVNCFDLDAVLEKDTSVFYDDAHFNENGARKVADALAGHLIDSGVF